MKPTKSRGKQRLPMATTAIFSRPGSHEGRQRLSFPLSLCAPTPGRGGARGALRTGRQGDGDAHLFEHGNVFFTGSPFALHGDRFPGTDKVRRGVTPSVT